MSDIVYVCAWVFHERCRYFMEGIWYSTFLHFYGLLQASALLQWQQSYVVCDYNDS